MMMNKLFEDSKFIVHKTYDKTKICKFCVNIFAVEYYNKKILLLL